MSQMNKDQQKIIQVIENNSKKLIEFTQTLIKIKSVNPYTPDISSMIDKPIEKEVAQSIFDKLSSFGLEPKFQADLPNRPNVICPLKKQGSPVLILNGHMDTVSAGDKTKWKYPPFSGKIKGNKLFGRGSFDMKTSLAAMAFAMKALKDISLKGNVIFTAVVDEEPGAYSKIGTEYLLKKGLNGD